jgi:hypothetical protein
MNRPSLLRRAMLKQHQAVFNRHDAIVDPIQQQQTAARLIDDARLYKRELLLRAGHELLDGLVPVLGCPCGGYPIRSACSSFVPGPRKHTQTDTHGH